MKTHSSLIINRLFTGALAFITLFCVVSSVGSVGLDDQLRLIRGAFQDGLYDLVYPEATSFLEKAGNHRARGEVFLILGFIEKHNRNLKKAQDYFTKATISDDPEIRLQGYYQAASIAWSQSDYLKAIDGFQAIIDENQGGRITEQSYYWLVLCLFRSQQYEAVIQKVTDIIEHDIGLDGEKLIQIIFYRAQSYFRKNLWNEAKADLEMVYQADTGSLKDDAALTLARIYLSLKNLKMADAWATKRLKTGYNRDAHLIKISYALDSKDYSCARHHLKAIAEDNLTDSYGREWVQWKIAECELDIALQTTRTWWLPMIDFCRNNPESTFVDNVLTEFLRISDISSAPDGMTELLVTSRKWDAARYGLQIAQLYLMENDSEAALYWMLRFFIQNENMIPDTNTRLLMARLLAASGDSKIGADEILRLNITGDIFSQDVEAIMQQAELFDQSGMYQQAASLFQHLIVAPESSDKIRATSLFRLGNAYFQMEQWVFASDIYKRFLELHPDANSVQREQSMRRIALSCIYAQDWKQAETAVQDYLSIFEETEYKGEMYYLRGLAEANLGKIEEALLSMGFALDHLADTETVESVKISIRQLKDFLNGTDEVEH